MKVWQLFIICAIFVTTLTCLVVYFPDQLFECLTLFSLGTVFIGLFIVAIALIVKNWNKNLEDIQ